MSKNIFEISLSLSFSVFVSVCLSTYMCIHICFVFVVHPGQAYRQWLGNYSSRLTIPENMTLQLRHIIHVQGISQPTVGSLGQHQGAAVMAKGKQKEVWPALCRSADYIWQPAQPPAQTHNFSNQLFDWHGNQRDTKEIPNGTLNCASFFSGLIAQSASC